MRISVEERKNKAEEIFEEIKVENFPKLLMDKKIKDPRNMESCEQDKYKNIQVYNIQTSEY